MISKKTFFQLYAEKPELFAAIPDEVLPSGIVDEIKNIPDAVIGDLSCGSDILYAEKALQKIRPDVFVPTVSYTGTDKADWSRFKLMQKQLKTIEKKLHIYTTDIIILGSPMFWHALNGTFIPELFKRYRSYFWCAGCRLYAYALRVPLSKMLNTRKIITFISPGVNAGTSTSTVSMEAYGYYKRFMSGFGIELLQMPAMTITDNDSSKNIEYCSHMTSDQYTWWCAVRCESLTKAADRKKNTEKYFENFAIPATASILSRALSGKKADYVEDVYNILFPQ